MGMSRDSRASERLRAIWVHQDRLVAPSVTPPIRTFLVWRSIKKSTWSVFSALLISLACARSSNPCPRSRSPRSSRRESIRVGAESVIRCRLDVRFLRSLSRRSPHAPFDLPRTPVDTVSCSWPWVVVTVEAGIHPAIRSRTGLVVEDRLWRSRHIRRSLAGQVSGTHRFLL
jgi:hypothetical protein